ncbi:MAG: hypothetical protein V3S31_01490, partial [Dehalococcoidia bacterium]
MARALLLSLLIVAVLALCASDAPDRGGVAADADWERVEVTADSPDAAEAYLRALGAVIELRSHDRVQARVPSARLPELRAARSLLRVEPSSVPVL